MQLVDLEPYVLLSKCPSPITRALLNQTHQKVVAKKASDCIIEKVVNCFPM